MPGKTVKKAKGGKKKVVIGERKEYFSVYAPNSFVGTRFCCRTIVNRTAGEFKSTEGLIGRLFEVNLADLVDNMEKAHRKIKLRVDHVTGRKCLTQFHSMHLTRDKIMSLIKKRCTLIEARVVATTSDNFQLAIFLMGFTAPSPMQKRLNCHCQTGQARAIRRVWTTYTQKFVAKHTLHELVKKFIDEEPAASLRRKCAHIYPLRDIYIRKVKMLKMPAIDVGRVMEVHQPLPDCPDEVALGEPV